ncbi:ABC transporter ATP-binding protein [Pedosphaera parvula]|uniref:ABC transporter related-protein n=1 Tax=Pedosphaera parvula (strain Ellin514) TaxID=320771 RepID=B9XJ93_PEDPL|nr:ABC transporter ATP-binding protein [Pedosphaera parvula]EEF60131.1 ABC transporter related-protein [Pedosphaera parvula Ellin514]
MKFPSPSSAEAVVSITGLCRRFGSKTALQEVSLYVPRGGVFGLVGANGAGKTTLIKHILGLLRAESGSVRVFDVDPVADPVGVLGRIGYLSEQPDLPGWMRVDELMRYTQAFYPKWDMAYAEKLREQFGLDPAARLKTLSKGQQAKAGLLAAQAHRPDLLLLDEPSSGLDPIVRRDILEAVIHTVADEGRTVFFSSHLLEEIERVSDHIAMLHEGKLVMCGSLDEIKLQHRCFILRFPTTQTKPPVIAGALSVSGMGREWSVMCNGARNELPARALQMGAEIVEERFPSLNEIFVAHAGVTASARANSEEQTTAH